MSFLSAVSTDDIGRWISRCRMGRPWFVTGMTMFSWTLMRNIIPVTTKGMLRILPFLTFCLLSVDEEDITAIALAESGNLLADLYGLIGHRAGDHCLDCVPE